MARETIRTDGSAKRLRGDAVAIATVLRFLWERNRAKAASGWVGAVHASAGDRVSADDPPVEIEVGRTSSEVKSR